jgi:hypothetical protein
MGMATTRQGMFIPANIYLFRQQTGRCNRLLLKYYLYIRSYGYAQIGTSVHLNKNLN